MSKSYLSLTAAIAFGATAPAFATAATAQTPGKPPAGTSQAAPSRAAMQRNLDTTFKAIDTNGDGSLTGPELQAAEGKVLQQRLQAVRGKVEAEFTKLDTNKDGQLSKAEFMAAAPTKPASPPNGAAMLGKLDKNKDGKVSADEYRAPMLARFDSLDTNKDGTLSTAERQAAAKTAQRKN